MKNVNVCECARVRVFQSIWLTLIYDALKLILVEAKNLP